MGSVIRRGTRAKPKYYIQFKSAEGKLTNRAAKGATNAREAREALSDVETRIRKGLPPFPKTEAEETVGPLLARWRDGLRNRNAATDKSRITGSSHSMVGAAEKPFRRTHLGVVDGSW